MFELIFIRLCKFLKHLIDPESNGCLEKAKTARSWPVNLASFYGSHIDGIVCVKQIDLGSARTLNKHKIL